MPAVLALRRVALLLLVTLVGGCAPVASPSGSGAVGTVVSGTVTAGPTCPVQRFPPDPGCADRALAGVVLLVEDAAGAEVARVTSDADGSFAVRLAPGAYLLVPPRQRGLLGTPSPLAFRVEAGESPAPLEISYDTGIR
jgi:hypothetical protein